MLFAQQMQLLYTPDTSRQSDFKSACFGQFLLPKQSTCWEEMWSWDFVMDRDDDLFTTQTPRIACIWPKNQVSNLVSNFHSALIFICVFAIFNEVQVLQWVSADVSGGGIQGHLQVKVVLSICLKCRNVTYTLLLLLNLVNVQVTFCPQECFGVAACILY